MIDGMKIIFSYFTEEVLEDDIRNLDCSDASGTV